NDDLILSFRNEGFLYPTAKESAVIASKIINDASCRADSSYISSIGAVADFLKDAEIIKHEKQTTSILNGAFSDLSPKDIELKEYEVGKLSPTQIESYMNCPYVFMAERILKAQKEELNEFSIDHMEAGSILHKAMEVLLPKKLKNESFNVEAELDKQLQPHPLKKVFVKYYSSIIENALNNEYEYMCEKGLELFEEPEKTFEVKLPLAGDILLKGRIDRVDVDKVNKKLYAADYKTSVIPSGAAVKRGEYIQLALYIMALASKYSGYAYDGYYISIKDLKRTELKLSSLKEAEDIFSINGLAAVNGIKKGIYTPAPLDTETCATCNYRRCCGAV
ncbi:MAG: PD-(D/E)XK nuclease family protein, partial [Pseudomonadota bacterium]